MAGLLVLLMAALLVLSVALGAEADAKKKKKNKIAREAAPEERLPEDETSAEEEE
jgi:hypothetical protein